MYKFFVKKEQIQQNEIVILGQDVNHIKNVLRCKIGDKIEITCIETEQTFLCKIKELKEHCIPCIKQEEIKEMKEAGIDIHIVQALPKSDKMELIIQKGTELGVKEFTPLTLKRCVVNLDQKEAKKIARWQKIAEVAAKQCGRDQIPKINSVHSIKNIYELLEKYDIVLLAYEEEKQYFLKEVIEELKQKTEKIHKIAMIIGPEGGIEPQEVEELKQKGAKVISLGKRILRTETVAFVISSILMYELGDIGGKEKT